MATSRHSYPSLAARYVTALFAEAKAKNVSETVAKELATLALAHEQSPVLQQLLANPTLSRAQLADAMRKIASGFKLSQLSTQALILLADQRRLTLLPAVAEQFIARLQKERGEIAVIVTSAQTLSDSAKADIEKSLASALKKPLAVSWNQRKDLLGGLTIEWNGQMIDASVENKLNRLREGMRAQAA